MDTLTPYTVVFFTNVAKREILPASHFLSEIITKAGGKVPIVPSVLSAKDLIALKPDFIFIPEAQQADLESFVAQNPGLAYLRPFQNEHIFSYEPQRYLQATPQLLEVFYEMVSILHPQALNPE